MRQVLWTAAASLPATPKAQLLLSGIKKLQMSQIHNSGCHIGAVQMTHAACSYAAVMLLVFPQQCDTCFAGKVPHSGCVVLHTNPTRPEVTKAQVA